MAKLHLDRAAILRRARNVSIAAIVLLILMVGAGIAYSFYTASFAKDQPQSVAPDVEKRKDITPTAPNPTAQVSVASSTTELKASPGENALFTVRTNAEAVCDITVTYGDPGERDKQSTDSGLQRKTADGFGVISWTWSIESARPLGTWPIEVTCFNEVNSGYFRAMLILANE